MIIEKLYPILSGFKGCTFASLDAETKEGGLIRRVKNERVMLFTNSKSSGYENLVKRRLEQAGKNPDLFAVGDLPWGERVPDSPLIKHKGFFYLQTILLAEGEVTYLTPTGKIIPEQMLSAFLSLRKNNQGLPDDKEVTVRTYAVDNIKGIRLLGEELPQPKPIRPKKSILGIVGRKK